MEITEGQRLLALGQPVTLADGTQARIVFTARALLAMEEKYGSLDAYFTTVAGGSKKALLAAVVHTLQVTLSLPLETAVDYVDTRHLNAYVKAINDAIAEALPPAEDSRGNSQKAPESAGADISISAPSSSESLPRASGK